MCWYYVVVSVVDVVDVVDRYGSSFAEVLEGFSLWGVIVSGIRGVVSGVVSGLVDLLCVGVVLWFLLIRG